MITKFQSDLPYGRKRVLALAAHHHQAIAEMRAARLP